MVLETRAPHAVALNDEDPEGIAYIEMASLTKPWFAVAGERRPGVGTLSSGGLGVIQKKASDAVSRVSLSIIYSCRLSSSGNVDPWAVSQKSLAQSRVQGLFSDKVF